MVAGNQGGHGVVSHGGEHALGQDACGVNNGREPEPELQDDAEKLPDIAKEDIQDSQGDAEADGEGDLNQQKREDAKKSDARKVAGGEEECGEEAENNTEVQEGIEHDDGGQAKAGKADFFQQICILEENGLRPASDLGKKAPGQNA